MKAQDQEKVDKQLKEFSQRIISLNKYSLFQRLGASTCANPPRMSLPVHRVSFIHATNR